LAGKANAMNPETLELVRLAVARLALEVRSHADAISLQTGDRRDDIDRVIRLELAPPKELRAADPDKDQRAATWLCRFRIYSDRDSFAEPEADSDDDLAPDLPGTVKIKGLRQVADYAAETAGLYHGGPLQGLDVDTLEMKTRGIRPTLSRRGGNAVWRLYYNTAQTFRPAEPTRFAYMVRIDLEQIEAGSGNFKRESEPRGGWHPVAADREPIVPFGRRGLLEGNKG
jgi:hypothetical protein